MAFIRKHIFKKIALLDALNREKFNTRRPGFIYMYLDRLRGIQCIPPKTVLTVGTWSISSCEIRLLDAFDVHMPCKNNLNFLVIKILSFCVLNFENRFFIERFPVSRLPPHTLFDLMLNNKWITAVITNLFNLKITLKNKQGFFKLLLGGTFYFNQTAYVDLTSIP